MADDTSRQTAPKTGAAQFTTTDWTLVLAAGDKSSPESEQALDRLCRTYWYPLYAYVRRQAYSPEDAQDLTQAFFVRLLEKEYVSVADKERGKFRTFLLSALKNFIINQQNKARAAKRGGGQVHFSIDPGEAEERYSSEHADRLTPQKLFEKRWALTVLEQAYQAVRREYEQVGNLVLFDRLQHHLWGDPKALSYAEIAAEVAMREGSVKVAAFRLRKKFAQELRGIVAETVSTADEIEPELQFLMEAFR